VLVSIGSVAHAQPSAASQASNAAGALFDKGRQYLAAGKYAEACAAFESSQRLDPQLGTLFNLATCNAHLGKLATAWGEFHDIAQRDANKTRRAAAAREAARLAPRLPRLVIKLDPPVADATVTSNGVDVGALLGVESPVDLGDYVIVARAPGHAEAQSRATISDEGKTVVVTIALTRPVREVPAPAPTPAPVVPPVAEPAAPPAPIAPSPAEPPAASRRTLGIAALTSGGALLASGLVLGKLASDRWNAAKAVCGSSLDCATPADLSRAQAATDQARLRGNVSTALIIAGATVATAGGVYLWLRASSPAARSARLVPYAAPTGAGIALEGRL
jgi:tetratricopeptide (TPR) repeat protein